MGRKSATYLKVREEIVSFTATPALLAICEGSTIVLLAAASAAFVNGQAGKTVQKNLGMHMVATDLIDVLPLISKTFDRIK